MDEDAVEDENSDNEQPSCTNNSDQVEHLFFIIIIQFIFILFFINNIFYKLNIFYYYTA